MASAVWTGWCWGERHGSHPLAVASVPGYLERVPLSVVGLCLTRDTRLLALIRKSDDDGGTLPCRQEAGGSLYPEEGYSSMTVLSLTGRLNVSEGRIEATTCVTERLPLTFQGVEQPACAAEGLRNMLNGVILTSIWIVLR